MAQTSRFDPMLKVKTCFDGKMFDVANWVARLNGEDGPGGCLHMRPFQFHLKEHWRYPQSSDSLLPWSETISAHLEWWPHPANVMKGADLYPQTTVSKSLQTPQTKVEAINLEQVSTKSVIRQEKGYT